MRDEPTQARSGQAVRKDQFTLQRPASLDRADQPPGTPARRPDDDELWGPLPALSNQFVPHFHEQEMVLARFNRPAHDKVLVLTKLLIRLLLFKEYRGNRERHRFYRDRRSPLQPKRVQHPFARGCRCHDEPRCMSCRAIDNLRMTSISTEWYQIRMLQGNHVVKHEHRFHIRPVSKPGDDPRKCETSLGHI